MVFFILFCAGGHLTVFFVSRLRRSSGSLLVVLAPSNPPVLPPVGDTALFSQAAPTFWSKQGLYLGVLMSSFLLFRKVRDLHQGFSSSEEMINTCCNFRTFGPEELLETPSPREATPPSPSAFDVPATRKTKCSHWSE